MRRTLYVYRSKLALVPYSLGESRTLEKKLSIYDYNSGKYTMCLYKYDKDKKTLYIPKGFSKDETLNILATDTIVEIDIVDKTNETKEGRDIELIMKPGKGARDEHQINSISFLLEKDTKQQRFLNIDTGFGKTFCTIKAISMIGKVAMIVMANSNLMKQWIRSFKDFTNIKDHEICIISGTDTAEKKSCTHWTICHPVPGIRFLTMRKISIFRIVAFQRIQYLCLFADLLQLISIYKACLLSLCKPVSSLLETRSSISRSASVIGDSISSWSFGL